MKSDTATKEKGLVLLSGGLDSTVSLAAAARTYKVTTALFIDYGQHSRMKEREAAKALSICYGLSLEEASLPWLASISSSLLISGKGEPPSVEEAECPGRAEEISRKVWVENRNGIFLNIAAAYAAVRDCQVIIAGFNREEAATFPDNSSGFIEAVNVALSIGAGCRVRVESPTVSMSKRDIVALGLDLDIPWENIWSCYRGGERMCGLCESCARLGRALSGTPAEDRVDFQRRAD